LNSAAASALTITAKIIILPLQAGRGKIRGAGVQQSAI
jgi:hypothetical protein